MSVLGGYTGRNRGAVRSLRRLHLRSVAVLMGAAMVASSVLVPATKVNDERAKSNVQRDLEDFLSNHPYDVEHEELDADWSLEEAYEELTLGWGGPRELYTDEGESHRGRGEDGESAEEEYGEDPMARMMQEYLLMIDPVERRLPVERLHEANRIATQQRRLKKNQTSSWTERGPSDVGGRTRALMFDPNDATHRKVWAGGVSGGLWFTHDITDEREPWSNVDDFWANIAISSIAYDPSSPNVFYVGTGEGWFNVGSQRGAGIFKSTDGGVTWTQLPSTTGETFHYVQDIVVTDLGTVLATTRENGVLQRSTDGGATWTTVISGKRGTDLEIAADGTIYAAQGMFSGGKIWRSNNDGVTWTQLNTGDNGFPSSGITRIELAVAPSNPSRIYAVTVSSTNKVAGMYRSFDAGTAWESMPLPVDCDGGIPANDIGRGQGWYNLTLAVNPDNPDEVILGSVDLFRTTSGAESTTWSQLGAWSNCGNLPTIHADQHVVVYRPGSSHQAVFGHDGGITFGLDVSKSTARVVNRNRNYNVTQFYSVALGEAAGSNLLIGGTQDNGSPKISQAGMAAEDADVTGGDGGFAHISKSGSQVAIASNQFLRWYRSLDGGNTFSFLGGISGGGSFINPSDLDEDANHLFFNFNDQMIGRLNDLDSGPVNWDLFGPAGGFGAKVSHVRNSEYAPAGRSTVFVGTRTGSIWKVANAEAGATPSWTQINTTPLPAAAVSSIDLIGGEDRLVVTFSNYGVPSVWMTEDGGTTWTDLDTGRGLPDMPVWWVLGSPGNPNELYIGTEAGLWYLSSITGGATWMAEPGVPTTRVSMLDYRASDGRLAVATHGRGIWTTTLSNQVTPQLALTALLQGPYTGSGSMETTPIFSSAVPTQQPYGPQVEGSSGGNEDRGTIGELPDDVIDWVLVSLRSATSPSTEVPGSSIPALLRNDGSITAADGSLMRFDGVAPGSYYVVLAHRNHLSVMSSQPVDFSNGFAAWDFTAGQDKAFGSGARRMASLDDGRTGLFAADATADGQVTASDFNTFLTQTKAVVRGYASGDFNLDGQVTATDFNIFLTNSKAGIGTYVP